MCSKICFGIIWKHIDSFFLNVEELLMACAKNADIFCNCIPLVIGKYRKCRLCIVPNQPLNKGKGSQAPFEWKLMPISRCGSSCLSPAVVNINIKKKSVWFVFLAGHLERRLKTYLPRGQKKPLPKLNYRVTFLLHKAVPMEVQSTPQKEFSIYHFLGFISSLSSAYRL